MARPITSTAVGRVNRRFLFLALILAVLSAVLVYAAVTKSGGGGSSSVDTPVVVATQDIPAGTEITANMVDVTSMADTQVPTGSLDSVELAVGSVAKVTISAKEAVLTTKLVNTSIAVDGNVLSYIIEARQRGMAIVTSQVIGAGGLVLPGDHVDIYFIPENPIDDYEDAFLIAENVEVLAVQQAVLDIGPTAPGVTQGEEGDQPAAPSDERTRNVLEEPVPEAATVTLMLTPAQAARVFCSEGAGSLRLAVRAFGDDSPSGIPIAPCRIAGVGEVTQ